MHVRRKTAGVMLAAAAAVGLTTAAAAVPASASTTGYYKIFVQLGTFPTAMCLQPADPAGGAGAPIVQQPCTVSQAQNWAPTGIGGSSYKFVNQATGLCMDVRGGAARGTPIDQWPGSSSYCLDVPGASKQAGLGVQIYTCNGTAAQAWAIAGPVA